VGIQAIFCVCSPGVFVNPGMKLRNSYVFPTYLRYGESNAELVFCQLIFKMFKFAIEAIRRNYGTCFNYSVYIVYLKKIKTTPNN